MSRLRWHVHQHHQLQHRHREAVSELPIMAATGAPSFDNMGSYIAPGFARPVKREFGEQVVTRFVKTVLKSLAMGVEPIPGRLI